MAGAELQGYLSLLARKLNLDPNTERDILLELSSHLEEKAQELREQGYPQEAALKRATVELGSAEHIAKGMYSVHSRGSWRDILIATLPHILLAGLFAFHMWTRLVVPLFLVVGISIISLKAWKAEKSKWSYTWLGYVMAAPALSWLMALGAVAYGAWSFVTTGNLPFSVPFYLLMAAYVPFSLWIMANVISRVVRQDWLLASLTALPFPFLTSWLLFVNLDGGLLTVNSKVQETDGDRALVFLALAVITAVFLKTGIRLLKIGLLTAATVVLMIYTAHAPPLSVNLLVIILLAIASVAFLLSPAFLESWILRRAPHYIPLNINREVVTHWFSSARSP